VRGDKFAGEWPVEAFARYGIRYEQSAAPKSDIYRDLLPLLNSGRVELLDHPRLITQLCQLERRTARSGKDSIDHAPGGHDDICNAVAGGLVEVASAPQWNFEAMRKVNQRLRMMGPYRRPIGDGRASGESIYGERRWAQIQAMRDKRTYGW
jgi:hypothetical protein